MDTVSTVDYDKLYTDILQTKCYLHLSQNRVNRTHTFLLDITVTLLVPFPITNELIKVFQQDSAMPLLFT